MMEFEVTGAVKSYSTPKQPIKSSVSSGSAADFEVDLNYKLQQSENNAFIALKLGKQLSWKRVESSGKNSSESDDSRHSASLNEIYATHGKQKALFLELLRSEQQYVFALHSIVSKIMLPLQIALESFKEPIIARDMLSMLFGNVVKLFQINLEFLTIIERYLGLETSADNECKAHESDDHDLADAFAAAFTDMLPEFKTNYSEYAKHYERAVSMMEECRQKNPLFKRLLDLCVKNADANALHVADFLIKPVQRVCKYPLFFSQLRTCTDESHSMHPKVLEASQAVADIADMVNRNTRDAENSLQCLHIARRLEGGEKPFEINICVPNRIYLATFQCKVHVSSQEPGAKPRKEMFHAPNKKWVRECFLFSDILLIAKSAGQRLDAKFVLQLSDILVTIPPSQSGISSKPSTDGSVGDGDELFSNDQKRLPLDIVRLCFPTAATPSKYNPGKGSTLLRRSMTAGQNSAGVVVEKYTLWFLTSKERSEVYQKIETAQLATDKSGNYSRPTSVGHARDEKLVDKSLTPIEKADHLLRIPSSNSGTETESSESVESFSEKSRRLLRIPGAAPAADFKSIVKNYKSANDLGRSMPFLDGGIPKRYGKGAEVFNERAMALSRMSSKLGKKEVKVKEISGYNDDTAKAETDKGHSSSQKPTRTLIV